MRLSNRTSAALISSLFWRPDLQTCSLNRTKQYSTMLAPVVSVCHGGGPLPLLGDPDHAELIKSMSERVPKVLGLGTANAPRAIILVTAHWSTRQPTISAASNHKLYYDYGGFPPETYRLKYDAPGSPEVAQEVYDLLEKAGLSPKLDTVRGWDHGVFVPMMLINPKADIPIIQLSVLTSASPAQHFAMGRALAPLRDSNIAIIGSGMPTLHNLRKMFSGAFNERQVQIRHKAWVQSLTSTIAIENATERGTKLESWREWEGSIDAHPQGGEDHFLPLIVCAGAGGDGKGVIFADKTMGLEQHTFYWT